jgi:hypothetical protein
MPFPSLTRCALGLAAVVLAVGFFARSAHAGAVISRPLYLGLDQGLVGYWNFDGKTVSGTRVFDTSGTGNYGTMTNGPTLVNGKLGQGMQFDGSNDSVSVTDSASLDITGNLSTAAWVYLSVQPPGSGASAYPRIVQKGTTANSLTAYALGFDTTGGTIRKPSLNVYISDVAYSIVAPNSISTGAWHHIVGVREGAAQRIYVDGVLSNSDDAANLGTALDNEGNLLIGESTGNSDGAFPGFIDDVRVYNRALNPDEIKRLYKIGATAKLGVAAANDSLAKGLVGWWNFDGNTIAGTRVFDASGTGNYGTMTNGPKLVYGKIGQGMEFDGVDDLVDAGSDTSLNRVHFD